MTNKGLISKTYNLLIEKPQSKKWTEDINSQLPEEDTQMANRQMKRCSKSLIIREMQVKTTMRYHFTLVRTVIITKFTNNK